MCILQLVLHEKHVYKADNSEWLQNCFQTCFCLYIGYLNVELLALLALFH